MIFTDPLPGPGETLVIEASAGTGKTWTMSTLATRFVAERGVEISQMAIVTFSVAAAGEVKSRTRARFQQCVDALASPLPPADSTDTGLVNLWSPDPQLRSLRRSRLVQGLDDFDLAAIMTTHGFCDRLLSWLGSLADHDRCDRLIPEVAELGAQMCADHYLRLRQSFEASFTYDQALTWVRAGLLAPGAAIVPAGSAEAGFVQSVRDSVEQMKRRYGQYTFDDMLLRCREALTHPVTAAQARERLSGTYPVVLVDEFQDTDSLQWQIIKSGFVGASTVVLIGDPKQSIYGFRGADVGAYLKATENARVETLDTNHRSSAGVIDAVSNLMGQAELGDPRIKVTPVKASPNAPRLLSQLRDDFRIRVPRDIRARLIDQARALIDQDLVEDLIDLVNHPPAYQEHPGSQPRPLRPDDIAIIVATNDRGNQLLARLRQAGLPATFTGTKSVFMTPAAQDWTLLLRALESGASSRIRAASLTSLIGWDLDRLVGADTDDFAALVAMMRRLSALLTAKGALAVFEWLLDRTDMVSRLRADLDGERTLSDLALIAKLVSQSCPPLVSGAEWLAKRGAVTAESEDRRTPRNSQAIRVMTVHQAKGLQFPIVYLPQLGDRFVSTPKPGEPTTFHDAGGERVVDLGMSGPDHPRRVAAGLDESGESLRACYVALTRSSASITTWWVPTKGNIQASGLHRLLFRDSPAPPPSIDLAGRNPAQIAIAGITVETMPDRDEKSDDRLATPNQAFFDESAPADQPTRSLTRVVDPSWRRTSFSALTAASHAEGPPIGQAAKDLGGEADPELDQISPMARFPAGTAFGSLVHAVFEKADPTTDLAALITTEMNAAAMTGFTAAELAAGLAPGLSTPLGQIADDLCLAEIPVGDRLTELNFELGLALAGDAVSLDGLAESLRRHLGDDDPLHDYAQRLSSPDLDQRVLKGYLTGSIDAVLRVNQRYVVVDYKTNRLGPVEADLTLRNYTLPVMAEAMMASHYPLQALLYSVALHRFLRWRLPGYDPERHLGGVGYLFVRGMAGPATPVRHGTPTGVFGWRPPGRLIEELSDRLAGVER